MPQITDRLPVHLLQGFYIMPTYITHPQAINPASHPIRLKCEAVHQVNDLTHTFDVLVPIAIAANTSAISRLISRVLQDSWKVTTATATDDCF